MQLNISNLCLYNYNLCWIISLELIKFSSLSLFSLARRQTCTKDRVALCCTAQTWNRWQNRELGKLSPFLSDADRASVKPELAGGLQEPRSRRMQEQLMDASCDQGRWSVQTVATPAQWPCWGKYVVMKPRPPSSSSVKRWLASAPAQTEAQQDYCRGRPEVKLRLEINKPIAFINLWPLNWRNWIDRF